MLQTEGERADSACRSLIQDMVKTLMSQKAMQDWNIVVEQDLIQMQTNILAAPQMISGKQIIKCDEQALRR